MLRYGVQRLIGYYYAEVIMIKLSFSKDKEPELYIKLDDSTTLIFSAETLLTKPELNERFKDTKQTRLPMSRI
jgi:hypothetical protein